MPKKFKLNLKNWLTWLNIIAVLCVMTTIGTAYYSADDFLTKAMALVAFWWVIIILFYISENTDELKVKELFDEMKKRDGEWAEITGAICEYSDIEGKMKEKELDELAEKIIEINTDREERENQLAYISPHELDK